MANLHQIAQILDGSHIPKICSGQWLQRMVCSVLWSCFDNSLLSYFYLTLTVNYYRYLQSHRLVFDGMHGITWICDIRFSECVCPVCSLGRCPLVVIGAEISLIWDVKPCSCLPCDLSVNWARFACTANLSFLCKCALRGFRAKPWPCLGFFCLFIFNF